MILDRTLTSQLVENRFGTGVEFDKANFLHLCEIYMRNEKAIYNQVMTQPALVVARALIKFVVEQEAITQDGDEPLYAAVRGIIQGVGGHSYYQPLLNSVMGMVQKERLRRKYEA